MAKLKDIIVNGLKLQSWHSDWTAQQIDNAVDLVLNGKLGTLPEDGSGQIQADYSEVNSQRIAYIKGRPFGPEEVILEKSALEFSPDDTVFIPDIYGLALPVELTPGETYQVTWDGVPHICKAKEMAENNGNGLTWSFGYYIGNWFGVLGAGGIPSAHGDTGEPFLIAFDRILTRQTDASHTVEIIRVKELGMDYLAGLAPHMVFRYSKMTFAQQPANSFDAMGYTWWQVSDLLPTAEELMSAHIGVTIDGEATFRTPASEEIVLDDTPITGFQFSTEPAAGFLVARRAGEITTEYLGEEVTISVPATGVYLAHTAGETVPETYGVCVAYHELHKMDERLLPTASETRISKLENEVADLPTKKYVDEAVAGAVGGTEEETTTEVDVLPETALSGFAMFETYGEHGVSHDVDYTLTIGESYTVVWDGEEFECVAQDGSAVMSGVIGLGNAAGWGLSGNNEPFVIGWLPGDATYLALSDTEAGGSHTVRIYQVIGGGASSKVPAVTAADNGKIYQVVDGKMAVVALADSSVKTYIDEYISAALGGEY